LGIVTREEAIKLASLLRKDGRIIVLANGVFDLFHPGHAVYLKEAKAYGDVLFVAVNSDASVKRIKGEKRPIQTEEERAFLVSCIRWVDYVFIFDEENVEKVLREIKPHFHAKGGDYTPDTVPEREVAISIGTKTVIAGSEKIASTTDIIRKILEEYKCNQDE